MNYYSFLAASAVGCWSYGPVMKQETAGEPYICSVWRQATKFTLDYLEP